MTAALCLLFIFLPSPHAHAQMMDNENFGQNTVKKGGLWLDRKKKTSQPPAPRFKYRSEGQTRTPNRLEHRAAPKRPWQEPANNAQTQSRFNNSRNSVESESLAPLPGTEQDNSGTPSQQSQSPSPYNSPAASQDISGLRPLSGDVWQDISMGQLEKVLPQLKLPLLSPTYQDLLAQTFLSNDSKPNGSQSEPLKFQAMRFKVLYRAGLIGVLQSYIKKLPQQNQVSRFFMIKARFADGRDKAQLCEDLTQITADETAMPKDIFGDLILFKTYCNGLSGNIQAAQLSIGLAREQGVTAEIPYAVIDFMAGMGKPRFSLPNKLLLRDYLFLTLSGGKAASNLLKVAEPALLHHLSHDRKFPEEQRALAAERFALIDLRDSKKLANVYLDLSRRGSDNSALRRAEMFQAITRDRQTERKARKMQMFLMNAKRNHLALPIAKILLPELKRINPQRHMDWFAATAAEIAILAEDYPLAMKWIVISKRLKAGKNGAVANLFILMEIADPKHTLPKRTGLLSAGDLAKNNALKPYVLHRLVTVLDALEYNIPIPLWEASSQTPQPQSGYLPPSGALSALKSAATAKAPARTILMAIEATGKVGAKGVHIIGLRDIIQNLRKAGYEKAARRMGFEALYAIWPW